MKIRTVAAAMAVAAALAGATAPAAAQTSYPSQPVRWIVPFPPGGAMDVMARTLAEAMASDLGKPVVIENMAGAGGNIGSANVARATADGHTMIIVANGMAVNKYLYKTLAYDPIKDFAPVGLVAVVPNVLVTNAAHNSVRTVTDVIAHARSKPDGVTVASAGIGTSIHLASELFQSMTGVKMLHIPYRGSSPAVADLLTGRVDYMFDSITSAQRHIASGALTPIAVTTSKRSSALPNVPTVAEAGVDRYELSPWFAVFMPAATPKDRVARMHKALASALQQPKVRERFASIGAEPFVSTPAELESHLAGEMKKWGDIIKERNIRAD